MIDKKVFVILIIAGLFCLTSLIMSVYSISTADWSTLSPYSIGLFQTCFNSQCTKNLYGNMNDETNAPPIFSKRFFNAAPLSVVGSFIQFITCFLCFFTAFVYLPPKPSITCYITPLFIFLAFLFQLGTIAEAAHAIHLNGRSSVIFETALVLQVIVLILTTMAADRINQTTTVQYV